MSSSQRYYPNLCQLHPTLLAPSSFGASSVVVGSFALYSVLNASLSHLLTDLALSLTDKLQEFEIKSPELSNLFQLNPRFVRSLLY